jgi:nitrogen-specific signal transduction histidine kinase
MTNDPFSVEDYELLKTMADQTASSLLNLKLSLQYVKTKELEAFQTLSIFFLHDLKNLASTLSLTMQNLPVHYEDPEFRDDALRVMNSSVDKINTMCQRLSVLTSQLELQRAETDLNSLVKRTLADLNGAVQASLTQELLPLPPPQSGRGAIPKSVSQSRPECQ